MVPDVKCKLNLFPVPTLISKLHEGMRIEDRRSPGSGPDI